VEQTAKRSEPNRPDGLARTIFATFKTYLIDQRGIITDSSDKQVVQSAIFVVQKFLTLLSLLPEESTAFEEVVELLGDNATTMTCSQQGCRNYQRILEVQETPERGPVLRKFVQKLLEPAIFKKLMVDQYANYVLQHIITCKERPVSEKLEVLQLVDDWLLHYATHNYARHVVQRCFEPIDTISGQKSWTEKQREILRRVFARNGHLRPEFKALQQPLAEHVLAKMKKVVQA